MLTSSSQIVYTNKARCRDCYRCIRVCPVKAIRITKDQANVVEDRCISCGTCIRECPQEAKSYRNDLQQVKNLAASGNHVAACIAPAYAAEFTGWQRKRLPSVLRKLGFSFIAETGAGAYLVSNKISEILSRRKSQPYIVTSCPAVVNYIEKYRSNLTEYLVNVVSPMIAISRHIKKESAGKIKIVFIGPCIAKKDEVERAEYSECIDYALTFQELSDWFKEEEIDISCFEETPFDIAAPRNMRRFPLESASIPEGCGNFSITNPEIITASGFEELKEIFDEIEREPKPVIIEALFCKHGCINGPAFQSSSNIYQRRREILQYSAENEERPGSEFNSCVNLSANFKGSKKTGFNKIVSEDEIRQILEKTGKSAPEDQLNCGACGYSTCREQAAAAINGMAEPEMCIPFMRRIAEQRSDKIIETTPNGIIILDEHLNIISMNKSFKKIFSCSDAMCRKHISALMDPEPFEKLAAGVEDLIKINARHDRLNIICHEILYSLKEERQYAGIFVNITSVMTNQEKLDELRANTIHQARELLEHQMSMAQHITKYLGESAAKGEAIVEKLILLANEKADKNNGISAS